MWSGRAQLPDLVRDQRTYLKRDVVNALDECADVKAYREGTAPDLAIFDNRTLTEWADANADQLLNGAPRQTPPLLLRAPMRSKS